MFVRGLGVPRVIVGWALCCFFFTAQTRTQAERLRRAETLSPAVAQFGTGQLQSPPDHLGSSTTRALKPSPTLVSLVASAAEPASPMLHGFFPYAGPRAEPLPKRTAERPVLRI